MIIKYLKEDSVDILKKRDLSENVKYYDGDNSWIVTKYLNNGTEIYGKYEVKQFPDFSLKTENGIADDYENMKIIYDSLKELTDSQASDERIWSGLAHSYCWDYMQKRWPLPENLLDRNSHILNNYFFWNSTKAVFLNGISRLWWYARYTYDSRFENPYELTQYICNNDINGKIFPLLACKFATNPEVFKNIIISVKNYEEENKIKLSREQFNELKRYLNRLSGKLVLDVLTYEDLNAKIVNEILRII